MISIDVIDKNEEVKKPVIEVTENEAQTELITADVIDKKEEVQKPIIEVTEDEAQTD